LPRRTATVRLIRWIPGPARVHRLSLSDLAHRPIDQRGPHVLQVAAQDGLEPRDHRQLAVLHALAVHHPEHARVEVEVCQLEMRKLRAPEPGEERRRFSFKGVKRVDVLEERIHRS
jgi:hypothetical protein